MNTAPVFIIDDDKDELDIVTEIWQEMNFENRLEVFSDPGDLFEKLFAGDVNPFMIISDVNLRKMDGFELRQKLAEHPSLRYKAIPLVFLSTLASNEQIKKAYDSGGHGFFLKGNNYKEIKDSLILIMAYWRASKCPVAPPATPHQPNKSNRVGPM